MKKETINFPKKCWHDFLYNFSACLHGRPIPFEPGMNYYKCFTLPDSPSRNLLIKNCDGIFIARDLLINVTSLIAAYNSEKDILILICSKPGAPHYTYCTFRFHDLKLTTQIRELC